MMAEEPENTRGRGTIAMKPDYNPKWAAERLKKAMRGIGSDERMIIKILVTHDSLQRAEIIEQYKMNYGQDLVEDLKEELGGHFEEAVVALLTSKYDFLVQALHNSFSIMGSDPKTLIEILCCRNSENIADLDRIYRDNYNESLEAALKSHLSGNFRKLMICMISGSRPDEGECNIEEAKEDAQKLYDAGIGYKHGTDGDDFISIFSNRCYGHLGKVFEEYESLSDEKIDVSINSEFKGDIRDGLLAIVKRVEDPTGFFAARLNESMRGVGTDDKALIRLIVSRSEEDLEDIKDRFMDIYGNSLASDVKGDTSGDYQKLLLAIINNKPKV